MLSSRRDSHSAKGQRRNSCVESLHCVGERWRNIKSHHLTSIADEDSLLRVLLSRCVMWETTEGRKEEIARGEKMAGEGNMFFCIAALHIFYFFAARFSKRSFENKGRMWSDLHYRCRHQDAGTESRPVIKPASLHNHWDVCVAAFYIFIYVFFPRNKQNQLTTHTHTPRRPNRRPPHTRENNCVCSLTLLFFRYRVTANS